MMWFDSLPTGASWTRLWSEYVSCACGGIRKVDLPCPACGAPPYDCRTEVVIDALGQEHEVYAVFAGAEGRYEDYELLALMEREWMRPQSPPPRSDFLSKLSERATVVLLYWTYFETRINRIIAFGLRDLPPAVQKDLLRRYDSVHSQMRALYQILFGATYFDDLAEVGAEEIGGHLGRVQDCRNRFVHGEPSAISDKLAEDVVGLLKQEHDAWIAVFNRRVRLSVKPPPSAISDGGGCR